MEQLQDVWPIDFEETVRSLLPAYPSDRPLPADASFRSLGLDSLGVMSLVMLLQQRFGLSFPPAVVVPANFSTPGAAWGSVQAVTDDNS